MGFLDHTKLPKGWQMENMVEPGQWNLAYAGTFVRSFPSREQAITFANKVNLRMLQARIDMLGERPIHYPGADIPIPSGKPTYNKQK